MVKDIENVLIFMAIDDFQNIQLVSLHPLGLREWWFVVSKILHLKKNYY